jgi:hypothetical protein
LAKGIERFWTTITRIQISFSYMIDLNEKVSLIERAWEALDEYELQSKGFDSKIITNTTNLPKERIFIVLNATFLIYYRYIMSHGKKARKGDHTTYNSG